MLKPEYRKLADYEYELLEGKTDDFVLKHLEQCIDRQDPYIRVLRMVILLCTVGNGLKQKQYETLRRDVIQTYGIEAMLMLDLLEKANLIRKSEGRSGPATFNFTLLRNRLKLYSTEAIPTGLHSIYWGYAPIFARAMEEILKTGWRAADPLASLSGPAPSQEVHQTEAINSPKKVIVIFFIGGVTLAEISALRMLSESLRAEHGSIKFIVMTTKIVTGNTLLAPLTEL